MVTWRQLSLLIALFWTSALCSTVGWTQTYKVSKSKVILRMPHPIGRFDTQARDALQATFIRKGNRLELLNPPLRLRVADLKSWVPLRDQHMRKALKADQYPYMELSALNTSLAEGTFSAQLKVGPLSRPIQNGTFSLDGLQLKARFESSLSTYEIPLPSFQKVTVQDGFEVLIEMDLEAPSTLAEIFDETPGDVPLTAR